LKYRAYQRLFTAKDDSPLFSFEEFESRADDHTIFKFKCKHCGNEFLARHHDGYHSRCERCFPGLQCGKSTAERDMFNFLK